MKKNYFYKGIFVFLLLFLCSGCNGDITRSLRHDGFTYNANSVKCTPFFTKKKGDTLEKIQFYTGSHIINTDGKIYEVSLSNKFSNDENCKEAQAFFSVKAILNNTIVKAFDNKYYSLVGDSKKSAYTVIDSSDSNYPIYDLLLKGADVLKVMLKDGENNIYYSLNVDGNIYAYKVTKGDKDNPPTMTLDSVTPIPFHQSDYGERIVDFNYSGDSPATYIKLESGKVIRLTAENYKDCTKYIDIACQYSYQEDKVLTKYSDHILAYNGSTVVTDYHKYFTLSSK